MSILFHEVVHACRRARRTPFITLAGTATLAVAIGATTLLYGLLYGIVHRPLPYPEPDALVQITSGRAQGSLTGGFSLTEFGDWKDESRSYSALALFSSEQFSVSLPGAPARPPHVLDGVATAGSGIYALAALLLVLVGLAATWWPALRAGTSSPARALQTT